MATEARYEGEGTAAGQLTYDGAIPAHQRYQLTRDRHSQPGPAVLARRRSILLFKGAEDRGLLLARNSDARILHGKPHAHVPIGREFGAFAAFINLHNHLPLFGELDRVSDEVQEHLT